MPGIINRQTGEIIQMPVFSKEQKEAMVQAMLRHYLQRNPQVIQEALESTEPDPDPLHLCSVTA